jgi:hypothetical protein
VLESKTQMNELEKMELSTTTTETSVQPWHNLAQDKPLRLQMAKRIMGVFKEFRPIGTDEYYRVVKERAPHVELRLYNMARSKEEYGDETTLRDRIKVLMAASRVRVLQRQQQQQASPRPPEPESRKRLRVETQCELDKQSCSAPAV